LIGVCYATLKVVTDDTKYFQRFRGLMVILDLGFLTVWGFTRREGSSRVGRFQTEIARVTAVAHGSELRNTVVFARGITKRTILLFPTFGHPTNTTIGMSRDKTGTLLSSLATLARSTKHSLPSSHAISISFIVSFLVPGSGFRVQGQRWFRAQFQYRFHRV